MLGRATIQVALVMTSIVVLGVFMVCALLKLNGYGLDWMGDVVWNPVAVFVRHHGFHLLWVPVIWTCFAVVAQRRDRGDLYSATYWVGVLMAAGMFVTFLYAALAPYKRESLMAHTIRKREESRKQAAAAAQE